MSVAQDTPYGQANTLDSLGYAHHRLGEHAEAIDCFQRAVDLFRHIGDRHSEGITLHHLGDAHAAAGDRARAYAAWRPALEALEQLDDPDAETVRAKLKVAAAESGVEQPNSD